MAEGCRSFHIARFEIRNYLIIFVVCTCNYYNTMKPGVTITAMFLALCYHGVSAQTPLDSIRSAFEGQMDETVEEFREYSRSAMDEYNAYVRQAAKDFAEYTQSIQSVWGDEGTALDTPTEWVEYSDDFRSRSIVDFDSGDIIVEVMLADGAGMSDSLLEETVRRMLESRGSTCPYNSSVDVSEPLTDKPVLEGLIDLSRFDIAPSGSGEKAVPAKPKTPPMPAVKGKKLPEKESSRKEKPADGKPTMAERTLAGENKDKQPEIGNAAIAEAVVRQSTKTYKTYVKDGEKKTAVRINLSLVTDNLSKNAALYKDLIAEFSEKFGIEQALIFAVMEQESRFNPQATSWVPAYGLMQLVPESGGFDAYRYVYGREWVPTRSYLFNPRNNIELGTAYLRILENQFSNIEDPHCRRLCVIAGYNTGAGNVSRAFTGNTNLRKALPLINEYGYRQLYDHLTTRLGTEEARNYVSGVTQRREKYLK